jgi:hypothetical protein
MCHRSRNQDGRKRQWQAVADFLNRHPSLLESLGEKRPVTKGAVEGAALNHRLNTDLKFARRSLERTKARKTRALDLWVEERFQALGSDATVGRELLAMSEDEQRALFDGFSIRFVPGQRGQPAAEVHKGKQRLRKERRLERLIESMETQPGDGDQGEGEPKPPAARSTPPESGAPMPPAGPEVEASTGPADPPAGGDKPHDARAAEGEAAPRDPEPSLVIEHGGVRYCDAKQALAGKPLRVLTCFAASRDGTVTAQELRDEVWDGRLVTDQTVRTGVAKARAAVSAVMRKAGIPKRDRPENPIPCLDQGRNLAWRLTLRRDANSTQIRR